MAELFRSCPTVNQETAGVVLQRFCEGADIGFRGVGGGRFTGNNQSALRRNRGVSAAIQQELDSGSTRGPFRAPLPGFVVNALSARDKPNGAVRLILDLSQPAGDSINAGIDPDAFRLSYTSVDEAVRLVYEVGGAGDLLFNANVKKIF